MPAARATHVDPARAATSVDFPEPVGPATQMSPPGASENVTPSIARVGPLCPIRSITRSEQSIALVDSGRTDMFPSCTAAARAPRYDSVNR
jgi:hypothetical protein